MSGKSTRSVLPWPVVGTVIVVLLGGIYLLIPDPENLIQRYLDAGEPEKVLRHLEANRDLDPVQAEVARLEAERLIAIRSKDPAKWVELFQKGLRGYTRLGSPPELVAPLVAAIHRLPDPAAVWQASRAMLAEVNPKHAQPIRSAFVREILASGSPGVAANLFRETLSTENPSMEDLRELLRMRLLAGQAETALVDISAFEEGISDDPENLMAWNLEKARVLRSLNRVVEAFEQLYALWERDPGVVEDRAYYEMARALSIEADRQAEVLPLVRARARIDPEDPALFRDLLNLTFSLASVEEAVALLENRLESAGLHPAERKKLAKIHEWTGKPGEAFDQYRALALEGDSEALGRLFEINEGLFRHYELAEIIQKAPGETTDGFELRAARLLGRIGEYERAAETYRQYLSNNPHAPATVHAELADISLTTHDFKLAANSYRKAIQASDEREKRIRWRKDLAWILSLLGEYQQSLAEYRAIFEEYGEEDVLPSIISLSSLLGDRALYRNTLETIVARNQSEEEIAAHEKFFRQKEFGAERRWREALDQYRRALAQIHADEGDFAEAVETIRLHSRLFDDPAIFEFYLNILAEEGLFEEGVRALEGDRFRPELLRSPDTLRTAVWVMESGGQRMRALALAEELYELFPDDASVGLTVARLLAETGRPGESRKLLARYLGPNASPEVLLLASEVASAAGSYSQAEQYLIGYIESKETRDAADIARLGDIRLAAGDNRGARESYRDAVNALLAQKVEKE